MSMRTRSQSKKKEMAQAKTEETSEGFFREHSSPKLGRKDLRNRVRSREGKPEGGLKSRDESSGEDEPDWRGSNLTDSTKQADESFDQDLSYVGSCDRPSRRGEKTQPFIGTRNLSQSDNRKGRKDQTGLRREPLKTAQADVDTKRKESTKLTKEKTSVVTGLKKSQYERAKTNQDSKSVGVFVYVALAAVSLAFLALVYVYWFMDVSQPKSVTQPDFAQRMQMLKSSFPAQEEHFWDMVEATVEDHLAQGSEPIAPIVLLVGSRPDAAKSNECLAKQLGSVLAKTLPGKRTGVTPINGKEYENRNAHDAKEEIDRRLSAGFEGGEKVAIVFNLDALPPCSILLFHSYCENDDARYKDAALIFTVTLDAERPLGQDESRSKPINLKGQEAFPISKHLLRAWVDKCDKLPLEKVEAMLSRVANNVGIVQKEKSVSC
ncbi:torsin-1A-interacting protein 1-like [Patiria miniata]|uniref:Torsin-1A-interacting protein 1/2 AAA+ activator domain-containing protein n=1 Tax=Patiria miniata TaxID=46514 RepID=A0A913Z3U0_PATMI|nr:torsin-1A-interacting protein 1-like [Patiria miniata]